MTVLNFWGKDLVARSCWSARGGRATFLSGCTVCMRVIFCGVLVGVCAWLFCGGSLRGKGGILREWKSGLRLVT